MGINLREVNVSVLMCVYNGSNTLVESVDSILNQTHENLEFIIVDDGSTDSTWDILKRYAEVDKRVKIFNKKNEGLTKSLNYGLEKCNGEYIARQDADDISKLDRIEKSLMYISNENLDFITTQFERFNTIGMIDVRPHRFFLEKSFTPSVLEFGNLHAHGSFMFNRRVYDNGIKYDEKFKTAQDFDFLLSVIFSGYKCGIVNNSLYRLRISDNSISSGNRGIQRDNASLILRKHGLNDRMPIGKGIHFRVIAYLSKILKTLG